MPIGIFVAPYKREISSDLTPSRYCAMQLADSVIRADDGDWQEVEVGHPALPAIGDTGGRAIVAVRASVATLSGITTLPGFARLPKDRLDDSLSDLTGAQRTALRDRLSEFGFSTTEIQTRFGNRIQDFTLRDVIGFAASRRLKPRYDAINDRIVCDGIVQGCRPPSDMERLLFSDADWIRIKGLRDVLLSEWDANQKVIRLSQHPQTATLPKHEWNALLVLCGRAGYAFDKIKPDTFPTTGLIDDFDRADSTTTLGTNWTAPLSGTDGSLGIATNQAYRPANKKSNKLNKNTHHNKLQI